MRIDTFPSGLHVPVGDVIGETPQSALVTADNLTPYAAADGRVHLRGRKGRTLYGTAGTSVHTLFRFYPRSGSKTTLAAITNGATVDLQHDTTDTGTFSAITGGAGYTANSRWRWVMWPTQNKAFGTNGVVFRSYDGATVAAVTVTTGAAVTGPYIALWRNRLFSCRPTFKDYVVDVSELNDPTNFSYSINIAERQGGQLVGIVPYGDLVIIPKTSGLFVFSGDIRYSPQLTQITDRGCVADNSIAVTPYGMLYVGRDGVYLTRGEIGGEVNVSGPLKGLFQTLTGDAANYPNAVGVYYPRLDQYWLHLNPGTDTHSYILHRLETTDGVRLFWSKSTNTQIRCACVWDSETDDGRLLFGRATGAIYRADNGSTDDGTGYTCTLRTGPFTLGENWQRGRVQRLAALYRGSVALSCGLRYNAATSDDFTVSLGASQSIGVQYPAANMTDFATWGRHVQLSASNATDGPGFEFYGFEIEAEMKHADYGKTY